MVRISPGTATSITSTGSSIQDGADSSLKASVLDYTNSNPLAVRLTDTSGDYVAAGAGTQYSDGDANADPTGTVAMGTDGSNIYALHTDTSGDLQVDILNASLAVTNAGLTELAAAINASSQLDVNLSASGITLPVSLTSTTITGTVAVTQSGTWDEVGINDSGNNISVDWAGTAPPIGAGVEATALRVTVATDSTGVLSVDDNGGALTVDYATTGSGTATGALRVELPTNGTGVVGLNAGTNNIGDVDVLSVIPGTGATNLGKAIDSVVGATDTGVAILAKHVAEVTAGTVADGDYDIVRVDSRGALHSSSEQHIAFDSFNATTGWTALGNDTLNLATTTKHVSGTAALTFDKVNGAANTVFAGIQKTITTINLGDVASHDLLQGSFYIPDITNVSYVFLRLGTDSTNYNEWRIPDTNITQATFLTSSQSIGDVNYAGITGNGWDPSAISYIAVGVAFDAETNTLAGIVFDEVSFHTNLHTSSSFSAEITSDVTTPNINLQRVGGVSTATNAGVNSNGTLRVTIATDDEVNNFLGTIDADTSTLSGAVSGTEMQVDVVAALPAGTNNIGDVDIVSGTVTTVSTLTGGGVAHDSADSGNPHKIGFIAYSPDGSTPGTAVAELDRTNAKADLDGRQLINDEHPRWGSYHENSSSALTDTSVVADPGDGFQVVITNIIVSTGAATAFNFFLEEGASTVFGPIYLEAVAGRGFCTPAGFKKHITASTAVTITTSAAIAHSIDIQYYIQAV